MEKVQFNDLLLKTAFSCMACDGEIHEDEVRVIKNLHNKSQTFGKINIVSKLDELLVSINKDGQRFLKGYFNEITTANLTEEEELKLVEIAIETIKADEKVEYAEVKFFKVIRSKLKIDSDLILEKHPDFEEYLEDDILSASYLASFQDNFFDTHTLPKLEIIHNSGEIFTKDK